MSKKINWTDEQKKWIKENGTKYYDYELAELFNKKFNTCHPIRTITSVRQRLNVIKPKYKHDGRVNKSQKIHYATEEEREWLRENRTKEINSGEITNLFNKHFNLNLSQRQVQNIYLSDKKGKILFCHQWKDEEINFIKDNYNKYPCLKLAKIMQEKFDRKISKKSLSTILSNLGLSYLKANNLKVYNKAEIGTIRVRKDSFGKDRYMIKIKDTGKVQYDWEECGRYYYKKYYGEIPDNHLIYFLDGDTSNFAKENLIAISKSDVGTLRALCVNNGIDYFNQGIYTKAIIEILQTEKLINK